MAARIARLITLILALFICLQAQADLFAPKTTSRFLPVDQAFAYGLFL